MVRVHREEGVPREVCGTRENCCVCRTPTLFWYGTGPDNVALCEPCAAVTEASQLPSKAEWIAKERRLTPRFGRTFGEQA